LINHETVAPLAVLGSVVAVVGAYVLSRSKRVMSTVKQS
jgi:hypothetical protein